jgi:predicted GNAT family acetyltransferase
MKSKNRKKPANDFATAVGQALRRAAKVARKAARMHGTPIYIWQDGKVVAQKP